MEPRINISVKHRILVNGKEYGSVDELPPDLRKAYEQAMGDPARAHDARPGTPRIRVNGKEYESVEALPPELRQLCQDALRAAQSDELGQDTGATSADVFPRASLAAGPRDTSGPSSTAYQNDPAGRLARTALTYGALALLILAVLYFRHHA
jgi:hypothetical protein